MTWNELATRYPEFVQWVAQVHGPLPDGPIRQSDYERFTQLYEAEHRKAVN